MWSQLPSPLTTQAKSKKTGAFVSRDRAQPQTTGADAFAKPKFKNQSQVKRVKATMLDSPASNAKPNSLQEFHRAEALTQRKKYHNYNYKRLY